ncbi:LysR family transcriptional regulator [Pseudomonas luteola]|uniref:LysR substrate-binding domain-containing protein n=1 Tax=Pseudomonas luteola TaxID=47886 RepID=UPI000F787CF2|nr:LysR substrate-binding domain-containing protein [Pseudomonas luteola]RRW39888.1 LysR family transcriptional regulator [Pseudomonas luteola]
MHNVWRFDPTTLRLFIAACEEGTIGRAAERESMVPSALSKRITELEEAVGTQLFYRQQKGIMPTPAGFCLLKHARHVLNEMARMSADMTRFSNGLRGHLRISANRSSIVQFLPADLRAYRATHPEITLELQERTSEQILDDIMGNQSDVGIGTALLHAAERGLSVYNYHCDHLALVVPVGHPLSDRPDISFSESLSFNHVALHKDSPLYRTLEQAARAVKQTIKYEVHVKSFDAVCRMVQAELGIAVIPLRALSQDRNGPDLKAIPLTDPWANRHFHIVARPDEYLATACRDFLTFLSSQVIKRY